MRTVIVYSVLLTAAMVGSYLSWTAEETQEGRPNEVAVYRASEGDVQSVAFRADELDVTVQRRTDERGSYTWIEVEQRTTPEVPVPTEEPETEGEEGEEGEDDTETETDPTPAVAPEPIVTRSAFTGSDKADDLFASFEPLMAARELDASLVDSPSFGFEEPEGTLVVTRKGGTETLVVGASTYGTRDRYAKHEDRLFLLGDTVVRPLQFAATRLRERRLQPWTDAEVSEVHVDRSGRTVRFTQQNRDDRAKAYWVRDGGESADAAASTWTEKLFRLRASSEVDTPSAPLEPLFTVQMHGDEGAWSWTLLTDGTPEGRYVRSDFLRDTVLVGRTLADEIEADLDEILGD